jgi:hypothetical protein
MARAPLGTWTRELGLTAAQIVAMPAGDWAPALFAGWSRAALAQGDREWLTALLGRALTSRTQAISAGLTALPQLARRADPRLGAPGALPFPDTEMPPGVRDLIGVLRFRYEMLKELGVEHHDG